MELEEIKKEILDRNKKYPCLQETSIFLFGSSAHSSHFHDIDIGVIDGSDADIAALCDEFNESIFPYKVDIVNFSTVSETFKKKVFEEGVVWLTQEKK